MNVIHKRLKVMKLDNICGKEDGYVSFELNKN